MGTDQNKVIEFLSKAKTYGLGHGETVVRFDTHISIVFLAGEFAYKLKRAVDLPFLDYRKLEDRQKFCEHELGINKIMAPDLYETVVPVVRQKKGSLHLGGQGEVVDWLVKMKRFDQADMFDELAKKSKLSLEMMENLSETIVDFYMSAQVDTSYGGAQGIKRAFDGHYEAFDHCPEGVLNPQAVGQLKEKIVIELEKQKGLLSARQQTGFVRHCHGDLHLRNICLYRGQVTLFDALEFEPDYAIIDVLYDIAFLIMDLCHRGFMDLANGVMNRYLGLSGDVAGLNVLPLFLASRSAIRTHVNAVAAHNQRSNQQGQALIKESQAYLSECVEYLKPAKPLLIAIGGLSGSGKSVLARTLAPDMGRKPGAFIARTDLIRKRLMKVKPREKLTKYGYEPSVTAHTYNTLYVEIRLALHAGQSVLVDGVFAKEEEREILNSIAEDLEVPFLGLWLTADQKTLESRVALRRNDASDADVAVVKQQADYQLGQLSWRVLDGSGSCEEVHDKAQAIIAAFRLSSEKTGVL